MGWPLANRSPLQPRRAGLLAKRKRLHATQKLAANQTQQASRTITKLHTLRDRTHLGIPLASAIRWSSGHEHASRADNHLLMNELTRKASELNTEFSEALPASETTAIVRSIHKWILTDFTGWTESLSHKQTKFSKIQAARGRKKRQG